AALATARELGLRRFVERVERVRARAPAAVSLPGGLTEREAEVLRLMAGGATNKQIGAALYLSANTVRQPTISIYRKTRATRRALTRTPAAPGRPGPPPCAPRHGLLPR